MENTKIIPLSSLKSGTYERADVVLVGGCFDIFHYGHLHFLTESRVLGSTLVILLESDEFIRSRKGHEPYHTQKQRAALLAQLECVKSVILLPLLPNDEAYADIVRVIRPRVIAVTEGDAHLSHKRLFAQEVGATVTVIPLLAKFSTTNVKDHATITND